MLHKLIIIGSGPAALTAAIYAGRAELSPLVLEGAIPGGPLVLGDYKIENFPGFKNGVLGTELLGAMRSQAERFGAKFENKEATAADFKNRPLTVFCGDEEYQAEAVIVATGSEPKKLGIESEARFVGRGISYCATCDGPFFKNKKVIVLGGGNSAFHEAQFLSELAAEVTMLDVADFSFASEVVKNQAKANSKIKLLLHTEIKEFIGDKKLEKVKIYNHDTKESGELAADGVFIAIGRTPATKIFEGQLKMQDGHIITECNGTKTEIPGVFAAGDAADPVYRQAIVASGRGAMAAMDAKKYLSSI
jgi:thioredoxin reductase (NADPH)